MNHYRDLNKELVEQVQTMRKNMKLYCDEIVHLKGELMRKHESEVMLRTQCYNWAISNFLQLIQYIQPESDILSILNEHFSSQNKSTTSGSTRKSKSNEKLSNARKRSSLLSMDLQRSNSVINLRKSIYSTSPVRSSNTASNENEEEQHTLQFPTLDAELGKHLGADDNEPPQNSTVNSIIYEEQSEDEDVTVQDMDIESICESVEEISITCQTKSTLTDVTNTINNKITSPGQANLVNNQLLSDMSISSSETLQEPRDHKIVKEELEADKSIPINPKINILQNRVSLNSLIFTDTTLEHFKHVACSTPNSRQNSLTKTKTPSACQTDSSVLTEATNLSNRPSRQCKPSNLAEPTLKIKLRNDIDTKVKPKKRAKSKTKNTKFCTKRKKIYM